jgi:hypothetical protein
MRVKANYQLGELIKLDGYTSFIDLVAKFTVSSLQVSERPPQGGCQWHGQNLEVGSNGV